MAYECGKVDPAPQKDLKLEETDEMRSQGNVADRLTVDIDCPSLGSSECPSMASSFSPLDSPTPTPTSMYSQASLASPGWHEGGPFPVPHYERHTGSTPLRSAFRLAEMTSTGESMGMPYAHMDTQDRMAMSDYLPGYDDNVEQFWIPSSTDMSKPYDNGQGLPYPSAVPSYPQMARGHYRHQHAPYLPESTTNPCLSRPMFSQPERMPNSVSMNNMLNWMPSESMAPQTITPSQAFPQPITPPPSYSDFPASFNTFKHTPNSPVRSCSLGTPSGTETPMSRLSGSAPGDYHEEFPISPYRDGFPRSRQPSRKISKKSSKQSLSLESLPSIIRQVQFKCKEPGCKGRFKRQEHLKRHMKSHSQEKPHVCWVPGCHRAFSRSDNLNAHYTKTHSKRGGRNRYVATLDETSPDFDPDFRGQLTADGRPLYGTKLEDPIADAREFSVDAFDE